VPCLLHLDSVRVWSVSSIYLLYLVIFHYADRACSGKRNRPVRLSVPCLSVPSGVYIEGDSLGSSTDAASVHIGAVVRLPIYSYIYCLFIDVICSFSRSFFSQTCTSLACIGLLSTKYRPHFMVCRLLTLGELSWIFEACKWFIKWRFYPMLLLHLFKWHVTSGVI